MSDAQESKSSSSPNDQSRPVYQSHEGSEKGMSDSPLKLERLNLPEDLTGKRVLDIGCNEGFFCAVAAKRGAARVVGLDSDRRALDYARERYSDLKIEFIDSDWRTLPAGPFDVVLWTSAMHYAPDPGLVFQNVLTVLAPGGTLVLECGVSSGVTREMVLGQRPADSRWYPTVPYLLEVLLRDYSVRRVTYGHQTPGDPVPRSVFHCRRRLPTVFLVRGKPGDGKTHAAFLLSREASKVISLDVLVSRIATAKIHHTPLQKFIRDAYDPKGLRRIYDGIDKEGFTAAYVSMLAETVTATDSLVVIEGVLSDAQVTALGKTLSGKAIVWEAGRVHV